MKIKILVFTAILVLMTLATAVAQTPMSFTYQAVVRNSSGQLVSNSTVGVRISIIQGSLNGMSVYNSTQTATTNANGLLTLFIGNGQNPIDTINWANGPYYLKSEVDPAGGSNYTLSTVQQMLSVPYALHAHTADNANFVEQQVLTMSGDTIFLTGGSFVVLPASFSGVYDSLTNKPTNVSAFTNDAGYLTNATLTERQKLSDVATINDSVNTQIKNLYNPTDSMDAVNLRTLYSVIGIYDSIINELTHAIDTLRILVTDSNPTITPTPGLTPTGALPGTFSIGTNRLVRFSQGNLQYTTTGTHTVMGGRSVTGTWRFADNQWDKVGLGNDNISSSYTGWIDLFGWGTSGYHNPNDPYNTNYQPYSTSTISSASVSNTTYNYWGYGPSTNMTDTNLIGTSANYDWGVYNAISNGGNPPGLWRTLTQQEWDTVLNIRTTTSGIRYVKATVNGAMGFIIAPDDWSTSTYIFNRINDPSANYDANVLTSAQWTTLENAGCAFLPAAGYRSSTSTAWVGTNATYWSATNYGCGGACTWSFRSLGHSDRLTGNSVRLVQDVR